MKSYPVCCKTSTPFAFARRPFTIRVENVSEIAQKEFIELITYQPCSKNDFSSMSVTKFRITCLQFCLRSCCACFFLFHQQRYLGLPIGTFVEQAFQVSWLSNRKTEVDSLQKMICVKLLRRLLQIFLFWRTRRTAFPLTLFGFCNCNNFVVVPTPMTANFTSTA